MRVWASDLRIVIKHAAAGRRCRLAEGPQLCALCDARDAVWCNNNNDRTQHVGVCEQCGADALALAWLTGATS